MNKLTHEEWMLRMEELKDVMSYLSGPQGQRLPVEQRVKRLEEVSKEVMELTRNAPSLTTPEA